MKLEYISDKGLHLVRWFGPMIAAGAITILLGMIYTCSSFGSQAKDGAPPIGKQASTNQCGEAKQLIAKASARLDAAAKDLGDGESESALSSIDEAERLLADAKNVMGSKENYSHERRPRPRIHKAPSSRDIWGNNGLWNEDPFEHLNRMQQQFYSLFGDEDVGDETVNFSPSMDVSDEGKQYVVKYDLPGIEKDKIKVTVNGDILTVSGESENHIDRKDGDKVLYTERQYGQFQRSIKLPGPVDAGKLEAKYDKGVLKVFIPKSKESKMSKDVPVN